MSKKSRRAKTRARAKSKAIAQVKPKAVYTSCTQIDTSSKVLGTIGWALLVAVGIFLLGIYSLILLDKY